MKTDRPYRDVLEPDTATGHWGSPAFSSTELLKPIDILIPFKLAEKDYAWMDSYGSTQILITLEEGVTPDVVTRKLLDKYKGYWEYWKEDNSTNRLFGVLR